MGPDHPPSPFRSVSAAGIRGRCQADRRDLSMIDVESRRNDL